MKPYITLLLITLLLITLLLMSLGLLAHAAELKLPSDFWVIEKYQIKLSISVVEKDLYLTVFDKDRAGNDITWEGRASLNRLGVFEGTWGNEKNDNIGPFIIYLKPRKAPSFRAGI